MTPVYKVERPKKSNWYWAAIGVAVRDHYNVETKYTQCRLAELIFNRHDCCDEGDTCNETHSLKDTLAQLRHLDKAVKGRIIGPMEAMEVTRRGDLIIFQHGPNKLNKTHSFYVTFLCEYDVYEGAQYKATVGDIQTGEVQVVDYSDVSKEAEMFYVTKLGR